MRLVYDIEANGLFNQATKIHCIRAYDIDTNIMYRFDKDHDPIFRGIKLLNEASLLIGHNILGFDNPFIRKMSAKFTNWNTIESFDTIVASKLVFANIATIDGGQVKAGKLPKKLVGNHGLKAWGYRLGKFKGEYGERFKDESDEDYMERVWANYSPEMADYCEQDVLVNVELYWKLQERIAKNSVPTKALKVEHDFARLISRQERHGVFFNTEDALELEEELRVESAKAMDKLNVDYKPKYFVDKPAKAQEHWIPCSIEDAGTLSKTVRTNKKTGVEEVTYQNGYGAKYKFIDNMLHEQVRFSKMNRRSKIEVPTKDGGTKSIMSTNVIKGAMYTNIKLTSFSPTSGTHIIRWLKDMFDWVPTEFTDKGNPKTDGDTLAVLTFAGMKSLQRFQMLGKRLSQLADGKGALLKKYVEGTNRIHGRCDTLGAVSRRCTHSSPNLAQIPANRAEYGERFRGLFTVPKGYRLVGADGSGLELRTLAHYLWYFDDGEYAKVVLDGDIHSKNQEDAGLPTRDNAKTFIYAFLYGAGAMKLGEIILPNGTGAEKEKAGKAIKKKFMKANPAIAGLVKDVKEAGGKRKFVVDLDGNKLYIRSEHSAPNLLLQSCGAIVMKYWLVEVDRVLQEMGYENTDDVRHTNRKHDYEFVLNVHDESQIEVKEGSEQDVARVCEEAFMTVGKELGMNILIEGEAKIGMSWAETH